MRRPTQYCEQLLPAMCSRSQYFVLEPGLCLYVDQLRKNGLAVKEGLADLSADRVVQSTYPGGPRKTSI